MPEDERMTAGHPAGVALREGASGGRIVSQYAEVFGDVEVARRLSSPGEYRLPPLGGHQIILHLGGAHRLERTVGGKRRQGVEVRGDAAIVPAGLPMEQFCSSESEDATAILGDGLLRRVAEEVGADPDRVEILDRFKARDPQMERLVLSFLTEVESGGLLGGGLYAESLANALAVHLLREHSSLGRGAKGRLAREPEGGLSARALRRATDLIGDNLSGDLPLAKVAASANLSAHHFARLFKQSTGLSPHQYVIRERVEKAKGLLSDTDLTIGEVAAASGFSHHQHLARHFKRLTGISPGAFRRQGAA